MFTKSQWKIIGRFSVLIVILLLWLGAFMYQSLVIFVYYKGQPVKARIEKFLTICEVHKGSPKARVSYEGILYKVDITGDECRSLKQGDEISVIKYPGINIVQRKWDIPVMEMTIILLLTSSLAWMAWRGLRTGLKR